MITEKEFFLEKCSLGEVKKLVTAVRLPSGATEIIINTEELKTKIEYIKNAYDDDMRLKANKEISIVDYMVIY
jgi:hypothetical protein